MEEERDRARDRKGGMEGQKREGERKGGEGGKDGVGREGQSRRERWTDGGDALS